MGRVYPVKEILSPRTFVYSAPFNSETLVLQSPTPESRIRFVNSYVNANSTSPSFIIASSNESFYFAKDSQQLATLTVDPTLNNAPIFSVPSGRIRSAMFEVPQNSTSAKSFVLYDFNKYSTHQFAGIGYNSGRIQYQAGFTSDIHTFQAAKSSIASAELMRIGSTPLGAAQVGIGTTIVPENTTLAVSGATSIQGDLTVSGTLNFDRTGIVQVDPVTQQLPTNLLPQKLLFLNSNNQVDPSFIPQSYNFQYLKAQKNVGIGTRYPVQKLHVSGSSYFSERIGIGTSIPLARIHAVENSAVIPALRLENNVGGSLLEAYASGSNILTVYASPTGIGAGIGIGTTTLINGNVLQIRGNSGQDGNFVATNITATSNVTTSILNIIDQATQQAVLTQQPLVQYDGTTQNTVVSSLPFNISSSISTPVICGVGTTPYVHVKNTGLRIDGDLIIGSQMYALSDARVKCNVEPITDPLGRLARIRGYTYHKTTRHGAQREAGVIAQEILAVLPEAVTTLPEDRYAVSYDSLVPLLIEAVRALADEVRSLKTV